MPGSSSTSFIPKHTPNKPERRSSPRQVFFGTLLVRILFVAVLVAALGVYLYQRKLDNELKVEVDNFANVASSYEADVERLAAILAMDGRLRLANSLLDQSVSINSLFTALERSVIGTVQLMDFSLAREDSGTLQISTNVETDSFDSTMFQRSVLQDSEVLGLAEIKDVTITIPTEDEFSTDQFSTEERKITFSASIEVDPATIPAVVVNDSLFVPIPDVIAPVAEPEVDESANEEGTVSAESSDTESVVDVGFGN